MKLTKRILSVILAAIMALSLAGCQPPTQDYDVSGYIRSVLDCCYLDNIEEYMGFTGAEETDAEEVHGTTVDNAAIRFCQKYSMNADDEQMSQIKQIMSDALKLSKYTVYKKTEAKYGYDVKVEYEVQTTFQTIAPQIQALCDKAFDQGTRTDEGAAHIDQIIEKCKVAVENPTYGDKVEVNFDIHVDEEYYLSLNTNLYDDIDEAILVF